MLPLPLPWCPAVSVPPGEGGMVTGGVSTVMSSRSSSLSPSSAEPVTNITPVPLPLPLLLPPLWQLVRRLRIAAGGRGGRLDGGVPIGGEPRGGDSSSSPRGGLPWCECEAVALPPALPSTDDEVARRKERRRPDPEPLPEPKLDGVAGPAAGRARAVTGPAMGTGEAERAAGGRGLCVRVGKVSTGGSEPGGAGDIGDGGQLAASPDAMLSMLGRGDLCREAAHTGPRDPKGELAPPGARPRLCRRW